MLDHVSVGVNDMAKATEIYDSALAAIGLKRIFEMDGIAIAYGAEFPEFWVQKPFDQKTASAGNGTHICFRAPSRDAVDAFHREALAKGAEDAGAPGLRVEYTPTYYGAFFFDIDGNKIEAVCHSES